MGDLQIMQSKQKLFLICPRDWPTLSQRRLVYRYTISIKFIIIFNNLRIGDIHC